MTPTPQFSRRGLLAAGAAGAPALAAPTSAASAAANTANTAADTASAAADTDTAKGGRYTWRNVEIVGGGFRPRPGHRYPTLFTTARIGGVRGIFSSDDSGRSWTRINDDQHQYAWTGAAITGDPRVYGRVYVATNGRGIVYGDPR